MEQIHKIGLWTQGPLQPYLGSRTSESTSIFQPWEKDIEVPIIRRAIQLRRAIRWFVKEDSVPGKMIFSNLTALTGLDLSESISDTLRTGSALHRFYSSRQSNTGQPGISPNNLKHYMVTADRLGQINSDNYDFMYQTLLIFSQLMVLEEKQETLKIRLTHRLLPLIYAVNQESRHAAKGISSPLTPRVSSIRQITPILHKLDKCIEVDFVSYGSNENFKINHSLNITKIDLGEVQTASVNKR